MSTATTTSHDTGQHTTSRPTTQPTNTPTTQLERNATQRLRTTMAAVKLAFTWLGVRKTLAPEQRTTAARAFHADRELLSASKLILDLKHPAYRAVAAVRSEASSYWRTVTLPFPEAGIRLLPQSSLGQFASTMQTYRERLQEAAWELSSQYDTIKSEAQRRLGTLFNARDYPGTLDGLFGLEVACPTIEPPNSLMALHPDVYQQEQARVRERFESAVELAGQAFATELQRLTARLAKRLKGLHDGQHKVFRGSAVENLWEFFGGSGGWACPASGRANSNGVWLPRAPCGRPVSIKNGGNFALLSGTASSSANSAFGHRMLAKASLQAYYPPRFEGHGGEGS